MNFLFQNSKNLNFVFKYLLTKIYELAENFKNSDILRFLEPFWDKQDISI